MATKLTKKVARESFHVSQGRPVIVEMIPPDMLAFRLKGCQKKYYLSIATAMDKAIKIEAMRIIAEKKGL